MNLELLKIYLDEWKRRSDKYNGGPRGFMSRSIGFYSGGYQSTMDDFEEEQDRRIISALDAIIYHDLPEHQRRAVLVATGQEPAVYFTNRRDITYEDMLDMGLRGIWSGLVQRDLV